MVGSFFYSCFGSIGVMISKLFWYVFISGSFKLVLTCEVSSIFKPDRFDILLYKLGLCELYSDNSLLDLVWTLSEYSLLMGR